MVAGHCISKTVTGGGSNHLLQQLMKPPFAHLRLYLRPDRETEITEAWYCIRNTVTRPRSNHHIQQLHIYDSAYPLTETGMSKAVTSQQNNHQFQQHMKAPSTYNVLTHWRGTHITIAGYWISNSVIGKWSNYRFQPHMKLPSTE